MPLDDLFHYPDDGKPEPRSDDGVPFRRAALMVVIGTFVTTVGVPTAEFVIWPSLVDQVSIEQTVRNIRGQRGRFPVRMVTSERQDEDATPWIQIAPTDDPARTHLIIIQT